MDQWFDLMILDVFSNLNDSLSLMIQCHSIFPKMNVGGDSGDKQLKILWVYM